MKHKFAAQLYTLRHELQEDFPGVLRRLKSMGWEAVQIDGLFGYEAEEIAAVLKETGLKVAGMHISLDRMNNDLKMVLHEANLFGTTDMFCHYLEEEYQNEQGYRKAKRELLEVARMISPLGFRVGYHHHDFEFFSKVEEQYALTYLLQPEGNMFIYPELDTFWLKKGGADPLSYMEMFPKRIPILHLKDMSADSRQQFAEIGTGSIDFGPILQWGEKNGVEYYCVEQDICSGSPFDSLAISLENLVRLSEKLGHSKVESFRR